MDTLFGSSLRTDVLVAIRRLGETYPTELAGILGRRPIETQRAVASLERAGVGGSAVTVHAPAIYTSLGREFALTELHRTFLTGRGE